LYQTIGHTFQEHYNLNAESKSLLLTPAQLMDASWSSGFKELTLLAGKIKV
jgi:hypothetical protein